MLPLVRLLLLQLLPLAKAFLIYGNPMALARIDPLVNPGVIGNHAHMVVGGSAFDVNYDPVKYANAPCTSIESRSDKSNYWTNAVYGYRDGVFSVLPVREVRIYYFTRDSVAFPDGFRMLAGSPNNREPDDNIIWYCQNAGHGPDGERKPGLPKSRCWDYLRSEITFPSCWTGDTSIADTTGQVVYEGGYSACPDTHPIKLPKIVLEFGYNSSDFDPASLVLANGDTTGYGLHGDIAMGWDRSALQALIDDFDNCGERQNPFGEGTECKVLQDSLDREGATKCYMTADIPQEEVGISRPVAALPGCNLLWSDKSTKPVCKDYRDPAFGPPTRIFESYGASYYDFKPGQLPIYEGDTVAAMAGSGNVGTSNQSTPIGSSSALQSGTRTEVSPSPEATNGGTSSSSSSSQSDPNSSTISPLMFAAIGVGALLLLIVGIYICSAQRRKAREKAEKDRASAVEEGKRLQRSKDREASSDSDESNDDDGGTDSDADSRSDVDVKKG